MMEYNERGQREEEKERERKVTYFWKRGMRRKTRTIWEQE